MKKNKKNKKGLGDIFDAFSTKITKLTGSPSAFIIALLVIIVWGITGPIFHYSDTWQLVINTGTTVVTFLMVFLIQQAQNKDTLAVHLKLNELIASSEHASNRLVDIEDLTEKELERLKDFYLKISDLAENDNDLYTSHSLDEVNQNKGKVRR